MREFYTQALWDQPSVVTGSYRSYANPIGWRDAPDDLRAWRDGETGYPIVDAGMRQLRGEAFTHNRLRMVVAPFLTKDLRIDWREGYRPLPRTPRGQRRRQRQRRLAVGRLHRDGRPAVLPCVPPVTQGETYDPDAEYVRRYVPQLSEVPADRVHGWTAMTDGERRGACDDYPHPIVDHGDALKAAIAMFERVRGEGGE